MQMKQDLALNILKTGCNVMLTGMAGAGKTYVLNKYIEYLKSKKVFYAVTASTGIAASHLNGVTIHSWSGIKIKNDLNLNDLERIKATKDDLKGVGVLIIDEISMLHSKQFELVDKVLRFCKENDQAFGGLQIIVCGDFFQLPPVDDDNLGNAKFCFMSKVWLNADFKICYLTEQYRQKGDILSDILNRVRNNTIDNSCIDTIRATKTHEIGAKFTRLYTHNFDVDSINNKELSKIDGITYKSRAIFDGDKYLCELIMKQSRLNEVFEYKIGSVVMFTKNNVDCGYVNGMTGEIVGVADSDEYGVLPIVSLKNKQIIVPEYEEWSISEGGEKIAVVMQLPLRFGWAITIHKSQGMTLDAAEIDLSNTFELGQGYVALSRLKSIDGMRVLGISADALNISKIIRKVDKRFQELSLELEEIVENKDFELAHNRFLEKLKEEDSIITVPRKRRFKGPSYDKNDQIKSSLKHKSQNELFSVLKRKTPLNEIAKSKNQTLRSVVESLLELRRNQNDSNFKYMMPDAEILAVLSKAIREHNESGKKLPFIKSNDVYIKSEVNRISKKIGINVSEVDIWRAMLFLNNEGQIY
jgi:hypothetical protein